MSAREVGGFLDDARLLVPETLEFLGHLVESESPTGDEAANLRIASLLEEALARRGGRVVRRPAPGYGVHLVARFPGPGDGEGAPTEESRRPVLVLGHMDTVHPRGTLGTLPFRVGGDRVEGPGVFDMKGGWVCFLAALDLLQRRGTAPGAPLLVVITCDEEVGSPTSRPLIEEAARASRACLVLEPSIPGGGVKLRRKGTGEALLRVEGRPAHAGIEPEKGASAVHELARQILSVVALADPGQGTHLNVGLVRGGTGANVVAAHAEATVDFRFWTREEAERVESGLRALRAVDPGCRVSVEGGVNRWALEPTPESEALYARARAAAHRVGLELEAGATGGASDGNLSAGVGCPTLDGLGPDGGGAHSMEEHILVASLPSRIGLLAGLLEAL